MMISTKLIRVSLITILLLLAACAPDDLDITPTATQTPVPTATPPPTPVPDDFVDPALANATLVEQLIAELPARIPAGAVEWQRDLSRGESGIEPLLRAENGAGSKVYYSEQTGGQMNLTFASFDSVEDAVSHYEFIKDIRQPLETGDSDDTFPEPNIFGSGLYGSVAIFQIDSYFIEVNIELFSSTQGNPLVPLSRFVTRFFEETEPMLDAGAGADETMTDMEDESAATDEADEGDTEDDSDTGDSPAATDEADE